MLKNGCRGFVSLSWNVRFVSSVLSMRASRKKSTRCAFSLQRTDQTRVAVAEPHTACCGTTHVLALQCAIATSVLNVVGLQ